MAVGDVITNARESLDNPSGNILLNVGVIALALAASSAPRGSDWNGTQSHAIRP